MIWRIVTSNPLAELPTFFVGKVWLASLEKRFKSAHYVGFHGLLAFAFSGHLRGYHVKRFVSNRKSLVYLLPFQPILSYPVCRLPAYSLYRFCTCLGVRLLMGCSE